MSESSKIQIADDGVAEVGLMHARAALTELIREVRYGGKIGAFTERKKRQVVLVTPEFYARALEALGETATPGRSKQS